MNYKNLVFILAIACLGLVALSGSTYGQSAGQLLVNEVEFDPPSDTSAACQYVEIRAANPGGVVPANTWFITVDNSLANPGSVPFAVNIGGTVVGSNGTITIINAATGPCPGRTFPAGTTVVTATSAQSPVGLGNASSRAFLLLTSTTAFIAGATNVDMNADGQFDFAVTIIDGFAFNINTAEEFNYGNTPQIFVVEGAVDVPDAVTRFPANSAPLSGTAFYWGELAASPDDTTTYADPRSPNFPAGGVLTPGASNLPLAVNDAPVDINGDGRTDYTVVRPAGGTGSQLTWYTQFNGGNPHPTQDWGVSGDQVISGDYDGDSLDDLAVFRPSTGTFYVLTSGSFTFRVEQFGQDGDNARVVGDYDGDGRDDLALYRSGAQSLWFYKTSPTVFYSTIAWGTAADTPAPGDYDGDGRADFAIRRASEGTFWLRTAAGSFGTVPFGLSADLVAPGDYDDDGKTDFAVVRTTGPFYVWEFEPSGTPGITVVSDTWGEPGDVVTQGDYDGDGRTDYSVWRPGSTGRFWVMTVGSRLISINEWGQTGDQPVARYNTF